MTVVAYVLNHEAEQWQSRADFYEQHRDYFPRLASSPFLNRCRAIAAGYRRAAKEVAAALPDQRSLSES